MKVSASILAGSFEATATIIGALIAAAAVVLTIVGDRHRQRSARRADAFAAALQAVSDYLEAPYRIRRRTGGHAERRRLTEAVSEIQSRIDFHRAHLAVIAPKVAVLYEQLVQAAKQEAGAQMTHAWKAAPTRRDRDVPLAAAFSHPSSDAARRRVVAAMIRNSYWFWWARPSMRRSVAAARSIAR